MRISTIAEKKGCCPGCGKKFKKDEPYPDVDMCEVCERFGPPKNLKESEYDDLEDADEFSPYDMDSDPIWREFDYRFLGFDRGHEFDYDGDTYLVTQGVRGRNVFKNGKQIAKSWDPVPWEEFSWNAVGHFPPQRWSWEDLVGQLHDVFVDYGDPGVPVYESSEYDDLEDADNFKLGGEAYFVTVTSMVRPDNLSQDDLINACREILARRGGQVGDFQVTQSGTNPNWIAGYVQYDGLLPHDYTLDGYGVEVVVWRE